MRKLAVLISALAVLVVPAAASAHVNYYNVTFGGGASWSGGYFVDGVTITRLGCWQTTAINPGQTKYVLHTGPLGQPGHFGLAEAIDWTHWHPLNGSDFASGYTRQFVSPISNTTLGTRRVELRSTPDRGIKMVNQSYSPKAVVVRANC